MKLKQGFITHNVGKTQMMVATTMAAPPRVSSMVRFSRLIF